MLNQQIEVPTAYLEKWQKTVDLMAHIFDVPAGLIMRVLQTEIQVFISSHTNNNPYEEHEKAPLNTGLYCETVMEKRDLLQVPNALEDPVWENNPDVKLNMISYLGVPLVWPDEAVFGTICILDSKTRHYNSLYQALLWQFKEIIDGDLRLLVSERESKQRAAELAQTLENLEMTQAHLIESEKMASLGGLVAGVAHEINTPIGIGVTAASTLADHTEKAVTAYESKQLKGSALTTYFDIALRSSRLILNNLDRVSELVQSFKQTAVDQTHLEQRRFAVKKYLQDTLLTLMPHLKKTSHHILVNGDEQLEINSYPGALSQVITNLIMNSLRHAYPEDKAGTLHFDITEDNHLVKIVYSDDGSGIPAQHLGKIFEPFFTTARAQGGTGLGLHIVYNLVTQKLQGTIQVQSEVGMGTTFILRLPLTVQEDAKK
jgi:signal transduction histidine kinase